MVTEKHYVDSNQEAPGSLRIYRGTESQTCEHGSTTFHTYQVVHAQESLWVCYMRNHPDELEHLRFLRGISRSEPPANFGNCWAGINRFWEWAERIDEVEKIALNG